MKAIQNPMDAKEVLGFIRAWVRLLSTGDFLQAQNWLYEIPESSGERRPVLSREAIGMYSPDFAAASKKNKDAVMPTVNDPAEMPQHGEVFEHWKFDATDKNGNEAWGAEYYLPLNGEWSHMCASFEILKSPCGQYGVRLIDLNVP
ncbi:MAG: hypothetical protein IT577_15105 [Verrucomicrobiae bacterium]|nr:hypothetical protein [Verrucomicrobiae bacterium]